MFKCQHDFLDGYRMWKDLYVRIREGDESVWRDIHKMVHDELMKRKAPGRGGTTRGKPKGVE